MQADPGPTAVIDTDLPWDLSDPARGEVELSLLSRRLGEDPLNRGRSAEVLTQIARAQALQGKLDPASRTLDEVERIVKAAPELPPKLRALLERGRLMVLRRTPMEARQRFLEAWTLATQGGEPFFAVDAAQMMSVVETKKKKSEWTLRALEIADKSEEPRVRAWRGPLHVEMGLHYAELLQHARALQSFETAAACFVTEGLSRRASVARSLGARIMRLMSRTEEALVIQKTVLIELHGFDPVLGAAASGRRPVAQANRAPDLDEGVASEEIGECLQALGRPTEAEAYFRHAHDLLSGDEWMANHGRDRVKRLKTLGKVPKV